MRSTLNLPEILARIEQRLAAIEMSAGAASIAAGKFDAIRNIRRAVASGERKGVSTVTIAALAPVLRTSEAWLLTGRDYKRMVEIVGYAAAGADTITFADGQGPFDEVDAPAGANESTVAVRVRGTSLGLYFDGWLAFYDNRRDPPDESLIGALCVCGLSDGRVVIKKLRAGSARGLYHLESLTEPAMFDQRVEWAAEVKEMRSR